MTYRIEQLGTVPSTNRTAAEAAADGAPEGLSFLADAQTAGRGRRGRSFYSPGGAGLYLSTVLRPALSAEDTALLTPLAAVAAAEAIAAVTGRQTGIKWVNDLYLDGRKVCGILAEAAFSDRGELSYVILGIGINLCPAEEGFPEELQSTAGALYESPADMPGNLRLTLAKACLDRFFEGYSGLPDTGFLADYRKRDAVSGRDILVLRGTERIPARALCVDDRCRLLVRYENGAQEALSAGEVSIRGTF